jgi:hypothetical protein
MNEIGFDEKKLQIPLIPQGHLDPNSATTNKSKPTVMRESPKK